MAVKPDLGVRVKVAYQQFSVGRILFPPGTLRQKLIERGLVEEVKPGEDRPADLGGRGPRGREVTR